MSSLHETCCPQCGCREVHRRAPALGPRFDGGNALFWLLGGFVFSVLWSLAKPKRFLCNRCECLFNATTAAMRLWLIALLAFLALSVYGIWLEVHFEE
ncbi:hypothetical protein [Prosthecobacter sp.]|uniref:hypothetical protein n=1 Tax=Prosthecobacter sp. TaxID=1965333 RepID=UPI001D89B292|nr:hypothetical protein [Prosthecobacter sp.]MCB1275469.1 hypothetical protein [Prosthecobacter sp.]